jgi:hypothetical protein
MAFVAQWWAETLRLGKLRLRKAAIRAKAERS